MKPIKMEKNDEDDRKESFRIPLSNPGIARILQIL